MKLIDRKLDRVEHDEHYFEDGLTLGWIRCYPTLALSKTVWRLAGRGGSER